MFLWRRNLPSKVSVFRLTLEEHFLPANARDQTSPYQSCAGRPRSKTHDATGTRTPDSGSPGDGPSVSRLQCLPSDSRAEPKGTAPGSAPLPHGCFGVWLGGRAGVSASGAAAMCVCERARVWEGV